MSGSALPWVPVAVAGCACLASAVLNCGLGLIWLTSVPFTNVSRLLVDDPPQRYVSSQTLSMVRR